MKAFRIKSLDHFQILCLPLNYNTQIVEMSQSTPVNKEFDIVVFGATGFTGGYIVREMQGPVVQSGAGLLQVGHAAS